MPGHFKIRVKMALLIYFYQDDFCVYRSKWNQILKWQAASGQFPGVETKDLYFYSLLDISMAACVQKQVL